MFNKFTTKSQEAIINAQIIAQEYGHANIEAMHLLVALLEQDESLVRPILEKLTIDPEDVRELALDELEKTAKNPIPSDRTPLPHTPYGQGGVGTVSGTAEAAFVLEGSKKESDKMKDEFISTEHIFLSLLSVKSSAQEILISRGVEYDNVLKILSELRGNKTITDPDPEVKYKRFGKIRG
jgi:ATP-dependent Clp protease ATP-binding subunit ClpA